MARTVAARALGWFGEPRLTNVTDAQRGKAAEALTPLLQDPDGEVRRAAIVSLDALGRAASPAVAAALKTMSESGRKQLALTLIDAADTAPRGPGLGRRKNPEVRSAAVEGILFLPTEFIGDLTSSPDPQARVTALLMLEWPKGARDFKANVHVPVDVAAVALYGPSHSIRYLGVRSLLRKDPADPTRPDRAIEAILKVANDRQNDEAAIEALDVLVPIYCGLEVPSRFSAPKGEVPWPIFLTRLVMSAMKGPAPKRLKVIRQIGSGGPKYLCGRWDLFRELLEDSDPTIRAEAFAAARQVTFAAAAAKGVPIPAAAPATSPASK